MPAIPKILKYMSWFPKIHLALKSTATAVTIGEWPAALECVVLLAQDSDWKSCVSKKKWLWFLRLVCPYPIFSPVKIQQYGGWLSPSLLFSYWLYISIFIFFLGGGEGGEDGNIPSPLLWRQQWGKVIAGWKFPGASHLPSLQCLECILDCSSGLFYKCWSILPAPWLNASNLFKDKLSQKFESHGGFPSDNACKLGFLCLSAIPLLLYVPYINIEPAKKNIRW